jgi:hypothetical protein
MFCLLSYIHLFLVLYFNMNCNNNKTCNLSDTVGILTPLLILIGIKLTEHYLLGLSEKKMLHLYLEWNISLWGCDFLHWTIPRSIPVCQDSFPFPIHQTGYSTSSQSIVTYLDNLVYVKYWLSHFYSFCHEVKSLYPYFMGHILSTLEKYVFMIFPWGTLDIAQW